MSDSNVTVVGNLTRDPELRYPAGPESQANVKFGLAVNRRWQNRQSQEWQESKSFFDVECWGQLAEHAAESLCRGARVVVSGRLEQQSWGTKDGDRRSKVVIVADEIGPSLRWATAVVTRVERNGSRLVPERQPVAVGASAVAVDDEEPF